MITRQQWQAGTHPARMLDAAWVWFTRNGTNLSRERKLRLYFAGRCRQHWNQLPWLGKRLVELCERQVDGEFDETVLERSLEYLAEGIMFPEWHGWNQGTRLTASSDYERYLAPIGLVKSVDADLHVLSADDSLRDQLGRILFKMFAPMPQFDFVSHHDVGLIRDVLGDPFKKVRFNSFWRTDTVKGIAASMYNDRDFAAMPILADALQDAGCENESILNHCREPGPHVRGCWVVDLVLGKQ